ncbi:unnamed protein product [Cuscuta campestris]|uniref:Peptidase S1 domain-containing protein n=1 Tax=Cuscuta campestris TaxID=132261 RepID=A0A484N172_9ASTE|nr:unnamed protein product [Cuscuta campestris]
MGEATELNFPEVIGGILSEEQMAVLYETMKSVVVRVEVYSHEYSSFDCEGAGVFVSSRHILTLSTLLNDDKKAQVLVKTQNDTEIGCRVSYLDAKMGLAILEIENSSSSQHFPFAKISGKKLKIGAQVYCIGHPGYLDYSFPVGHISYPCLTYGEFKKSMGKDQKVSIEEITMDPSAMFICYVPEVDDLSLKSSVKLVQLNNVHGDGLAGARGMPVFNSLGHIIGLYLFESRDQCYPIHAKTLRAFIRRSKTLRHHKARSK